MSYFGKSNFAYGTVLTPPSPAASGTSLTLNSGQGALFGSTLPYPAIVWPAGPYAGTLATAEIVLVTGRVGDVFTITRTQEGTAARTILAGDQFAQVPTAAVWQEIQDAIDNIPGGGDVVGPAGAVDGRPALFDGATGKLLKQAAAALGSAAFAATSAFDAAGAASAAQAASQPVNANLTAIALLTTTSYGRAFLELANAAAARTAIGAVIGTDVQAWRSILDKVYVHGADVASAGTIDLDAATGDLVDVTGTTPITAITLANGVSRVVRFTGALTLTHGASLVLPGAANITTAAGDFAIFRGYASSVVRCVVFSKLTGKATIPPAVGEVTGLGTGVATQLAIAANGTSGGAIGYRGIPTDNVSADYTFADADCGRKKYHPSADTTPRTWALDMSLITDMANFAVTIVNDASAGALTITFTNGTGVLAGAGTTGSRTLAANGSATIYGMTATRAQISGNGLT